MKQQEKDKIASEIHTLIGSTKVQIGKLTQDLFALKDKLRQVKAEPVDKDAKPAKQ